MRRLPDGKSFEQKCLLLLLKSLARAGNALSHAQSATRTTCAWLPFSSRCLPLTRPLQAMSASLRRHVMCVRPAATATSRMVLHVIPVCNRMPPQNKRVSALQRMQCVCPACYHSYILDGPATPVSGLSASPPILAQQTRWNLRSSDKEMQSTIWAGDNCTDYNFTGG